MKKGFTLLIISMILSINIVLAGELFDMDFSTNFQQTQVLKEKEGIVLLNKNVELGVIIVDDIHEQSVDLEAFSDSGKLTAFTTLRAEDQILQLDINNDGSTDFIIDIQYPIENNEAFIIVKKGSYNPKLETEKTTVTTIKSTPQQITGGAIKQLKESNLTGFLIIAVLIIVGLISYYLFTKKK